MKKILAIIILVCLGVGGWWYYQSINPNAAGVSPDSTEEGGIITEGASAEELIKEAFQKKYSNPSLATDLTININKNTGQHMSGGVAFPPSPDGFVSGGWFLAYKGTQGWEIVDHGNGTISCELIEPYDFPADMVPECWSDAQNKTIVR